KARPLLAVKEERLLLRPSLGHNAAVLERLQVRQIVVKWLSVRWVHVHPLPLTKHTQERMLLTGELGPYVAGGIEAHHRLATGHFENRRGQRPPHVREIKPDCYYWSRPFVCEVDASF